MIATGLHMFQRFSHFTMFTFKQIFPSKVHATPALGNDKGSQRFYIYLAYKIVVNTLKRNLLNIIQKRRRKIKIKKKKKRSSKVIIRRKYNKKVKTKRKKRDKVLN